MTTATLRPQKEALNFQAYNAPEVATHYASLNYLTPCEQLLFRTYLMPGMSVLDLGVGGGRTTKYLSTIASRYVGVDYSESMIRSCQDKFPGLDFRLADASDLSLFSDESFDAVVFSFNGLDYVLPHEKRLRCLRECARVMRPGSVFIFSSHNPRSILVRAEWDHARLRAFAQKLIPRGNPLLTLAIAVLTPVKALHSFARAAIGTSRRVMQRATTSAFWRGEGTLRDPVHGGLMTHCSVPERVSAELAAFDFQLVKVIGDDYPRASGSLVTDWYYYVFSKTESMERKACA
jgi:ubiquinone/menaquinone biosynthesis C-methylase UbiE